MEIFTLGSSTRTAEEFLELLARAGIEQLADVRRFPTSRRFEHFRRENLAALLEREGRRYVHLGGSLGGYRTGGYQAYTETPAFREGLEQLEALARQAPTAVMCAERLPWRCHRRFVAVALQRRGWRVRHLIEADREWRPEEA